MSNYKQFDDSLWNDFGKRLLRKKGSDAQQRFLLACRSGKTEFLQFIDAELTDAVIGKDEVVFDCKLTEQEFLNPPEDTQKYIWGVFNGCANVGKFGNEKLSACGFWGYAIYCMVKNGLLEPINLAAGLSSADGVASVDEALKKNDAKKIDVCTRRILRSMCNPEPRKSKRTLFYDFPLGKVYWRWYWAEKMAPVISLAPEQIREILNVSFYQELSVRMHTRKSCISVANVFGGLLLYLKAEKEKTEKEKFTGEKLTGTKLRTVVDKIAYLSAWKAIEAQSPETNKDEIANLA